MKLTPDDIRIIHQKNREINLTLEFLNKNTFESYGEITGNILSYNINVDGNSNCRRTFDAEIAIINNSKNLLTNTVCTLINWVVRPYICIKDSTTSKFCRYLCGTFAFTEKDYHYSVTDNTLSISCTDLSVYLDGTLGGNIIGVSDINIYAYKNNSLTGLISYEYSVGGADIASALIQKNTGLLINVPKDLTVTRKEYISGSWTTTTLQDSYIFGKNGGKINIYITGSTSIIENIISVIGTDTQTEIPSESIRVVSLTEIDDEEDDDDGFLVNNLALVSEHNVKNKIEVTIPKGSTDTQYKIIPNTDINIVLIALYDNDLYSSHYVDFYDPILCYSFISKELLLPYPANGSYMVDKLLVLSDVVGEEPKGEVTVKNSLSITTTDTTSAELKITDGKWHKPGSIYTNYQLKLEDYSKRKNIAEGADSTVRVYVTGTLEYGNMQVDLSTGATENLRDVLAKCLEAAGFDKEHYLIAEDITEDIPYDQEFSYGQNWLNIISTLCGLYSDIEYFFDIEGRFIVRHIPTEENEKISSNNILSNEIVINDEILKPLVLEEKITENLTDFCNVTEIWGANLENDYYSSNVNENNTGVNDNVMYHSDGNYIEATYEMVLLNDNNNIPNGTYFGVNMPYNIADYKEGIGLRINNSNAAALSIPEDKVTCLWTCTQDFYNLTRQRITDAVSGAEGVLQPIEYNGCQFYGNYYTTTNDNSYINIMMKVSSMDLACEIDGIDFTYYGDYEDTEESECMGILLHCPALIKDDNASELKLNVKDGEISNCIKFSAEYGEAVRVYYSQYQISFADKDGNILTGHTSSVNVSNKLMYIDFYPRYSGEYYVFSTETSVDYSFLNSSGAALFYGMSKFSIDFANYPIYDLYTKNLIEQNIFKPNESYTFEFIGSKLYYIGQWQVHAIAVEQKKIPNNFNKIKEKYNCSNIIFTKYNPQLAADVIGSKEQQLSGSVYENIPDDSKALQRAEWENWKALRSPKQVNLSTLFIPYLDINQKVEYTTYDGITSSYLITSISISSGDKMDISLQQFYPLYIETTQSFAAKDDIDEDILTEDISSKITVITAQNRYTEENMFISSLYNYNLFDWEDYINKYADILSKYNRTPHEMWCHWCTYGIIEGRSYSNIFNFKYYQSESNTRGYAYVSDEVKQQYYERITSIWGQYLADTRLQYYDDNGNQLSRPLTEEEIELRKNNLACYLYFIETGINDINTKASETFDIQVYSLHKDLQKLYGNDYRKYYEHYVKYDYLEHRRCI